MRGRLLVQRPLPALARRDAAIGVEIEKDGPAPGRESVAKRDGLEVVPAGGPAAADFVTASVHLATARHQKSPE
jgi:hypothetical protein